MNYIETFLPVAGRTYNHDASTLFATVDDATTREHLSSEDGLKRGAAAFAVMVVVACAALAVVGVATRPKGAR